MRSFRQFAFEESQSPLAHAKSQHADADRNTTVRTDANPLGAHRLWVNTQPAVPDLFTIAAVTGTAV
jgi:hypothetical protein